MAVSPRGTVGTARYTGRTSRSHTPLSPPELCVTPRPEDEDPDAQKCVPARDRLSEAYGVVKSGHPASTFDGRSSGVYNGDMPLPCGELINRYSANASRQITVDLSEHCPDAEVEGLGLIRTGIPGHEPDRLGPPSTPYTAYCRNVSDHGAAGAGQPRATTLGARSVRAGRSMRGGGSAPSVGAPPWPHS